MGTESLCFHPDDAHSYECSSMWSPCTGLQNTGHCTSPKHPISFPKAWGDMGWGWGVLPSQLFIMASSPLSPIPGQEGRKKFPDANDSAEGVVLQHAGCGRLLVCGK